MAWTSYTIRWIDSRISSDALYRERGKWISDRLTDLGWGKTADTGQIDWSSATRPGAPTANTKGGYEIRVSSGTATDLYMKISYGNGYGAGISIGIWVQTGEGSDGAGNLTGDTTTERQVGTAFGSVAPYESTWYLNGDADNFVFGGTHDQTVANCCAFGVQRSCNASGVDTNDGWFQHQCGYTGSALSSKCQYVNYTTGAQSADADAGFGVTFIPRQLMSTASPIIFLPLLVQDGSTYSPLRDMIGQANGASYQRNDVYMYGATRKYVAIGGSNSSLWWGATYPMVGYILVRIS